MSERHLAYRRPLQCVTHEIAPNATSTEAEMIVGGHSFCANCGQAALSNLLRGGSMFAFLKSIQVGAVEVAP